MRGASNRAKGNFFLNSATADYCDFICDPKYRAQFVDAVFMELRRLGAPSLVLSNLLADSSTNAALGLVAKQKGYFIFSRPAYFCAEVDLLNDQQRRDVLSSARRRMKRFVKLLGPNASIRVEHARSWGQIATLLPDFESAHIMRFQATGRVSNMVRPERRKFLEELARLLSGSESIVLSRLILNDRTIAWNYGFQFVGSWFWYQPTFDGDYEKYSPGVWLLSAILEEACLSPQINRVDLGLGDEGYKDRVATGGRKTVNVTASESFVQHTKVRFRYHAAMAVKSVPKVERLVRRLRSASEIESSKPSAA